MREKLISNHLAAFHYKANAFQFANVSDRITGNRNQIGEFPRLNRANAVLPAQHLCGIRVMARMTSKAGIPASRRLTNVAVLAFPASFPDKTSTYPTQANLTPDFNTR